MKSLPYVTAERRAELVERGQNPFSTAFMDYMVRSTRKAGDRLFPSEWSGDDLAANTVLAARASELFTVTPEMFDLIEHASRSLPPQTLERFDLPAPIGFLHLPKPLWIIDARGDKIPVSDLMWSSQQIGTPGDSPGNDIPSVTTGIVLRMFVEMGSEHDPMRERLSTREVSRLLSHAPKASLTHMQSVAFGHYAWDTYPVNPDGSREAVDSMRSIHDGEVIEEYEDGSRMIRTSSGHEVKVVPDPRVQFLKTYFHFVTSELSSVDREPLPKSLTKWLRRLHMPDGPVSVVRLRRRPPTRNGEASWQLTYRYLRRGHWRKQWYGPKDDRYQRHIWISPTVVGPDSGPLRVREVVNLVER